VPVSLNLGFSPVAACLSEWIRCDFTATRGNNFKLVKHCCMIYLLIITIVFKEYFSAVVVVNLESFENSSYVAHYDHQFILRQNINIQIF